MPSPVKVWTKVGREVEVRAVQLGIANVLVQIKLCPFAAKLVAVPEADWIMWHKIPVLSSSVFQSTAVVDRSSYILTAHVPRSKSAPRDPSANSVKVLVTLYPSDQLTMSTLRPDMSIVPSMTQVVSSGFVQVA